LKFGKPVFKKYIWEKKNEMKKIFMIFFTCLSLLSNAQIHVFKREVQIPLGDELIIFKNSFNNSYYLNKTLGGGLVNQFDMAKVDTGGNIISNVAFTLASVNGNYPGSGNVLPFSNGFICGLPGQIPAIVRIDTIGNIIWSKTYKIPDLSSLKPALADEQNNIILSIGSFYATAFYKSCIILKTDFNGNVISTYKYTMMNAYSGMDAFNLFKLSSGNYLLFISYRNSIFTYPVVVLQLDNAFNIISTKRISFDLPYNYFIQKPDDGFYQIGEYLIGGTTSGSFVASYSPSLNLVWAKSTDSTTRFITGNPTPDGGLIIGGQHATSMMLMKLDSSGNIDWTKSYGANVIFGSCSSIVYEPNNGIYMTGITNNIPSDGLLLKTDLSGNTTCDADSISVVLNAWGGTSGSEPFTLSNPVMTDSIIATFPITGFTLVPSCDGVVSVIENNHPSAELHIIPNPASSEFQISNFNFQPGDEIIVSDVLGKISFTKRITAPASSLKLQTSDFSNGIYFLQAKTKEGILGRKVMVQH
jgi:type IX secretion system substrate protein